MFFILTNVVRGRGGRPRISLKNITSVTYILYMEDIFIWNVEASVRHLQEQRSISLLTV